jgi:hypothetical protein
MKVKRFNEKGIHQMSRFIDSLTSDEPESYPTDLLTDKSCTESLGHDIEVEKRNFNDRFDMGKYLNTKFSDLDIQDIERDRGLWSWLALFYFDEICDSYSDGSPRPGERARWIPDIWNFRKYYRHLLAGPYRIYNTYRDDPEIALVLLCKPHYRPGDVIEQLSSRQELVTNSSFIKAATKLYVNDEKDGHKRGAAGKGPGSARRLSDIISQLELIWDLYSLSSDEILEILPKEFERFQPN